MKLPSWVYAGANVLQKTTKEATRVRGIKPDETGRLWVELGESTSTYSVPADLFLDLYEMHRPSRFDRNY